jgi:hypothetical protein
MACTGCARVDPRRGTARCITKHSAGIDDEGSKPPAGSFLTGKNFKAGGPPARSDGFDEFRGQPLGLHLSGQLFVVVIDRGELYCNPSVVNAQ